MEADETDEELIGGLCLDAVLVEDGGGKVALVVRDDHLCSAPDRGGEDVAVVGVGKAQRADEVLIARDQAVRDGSAHQVAGAAELAGVLGLACHDGAFHLVEDALGPASREQSCLCEPDEEVPLGCGMEHVCVEHGRECHQLGLPGQYSRPIA